MNDHSKRILCKKKFNKCFFTKHYTYETNMTLFMKHLAFYHSSEQL
jgi:hypothetical protein